MKAIRQVVEALKKLVVTGLLAVGSVIAFSIGAVVYSAVIMPVSAGIVAITVIRAS